MEISINSGFEKKTLQILLVGNNPIELSALLNQVKDINQYFIEVELAFDIRSLLDRLKKFKPDVIILDDNIGADVLAETTHFLQTAKRTREIPVTVLKNSNYSESVRADLVIDYLLKKSLTPERLYNTIVNTFNVKQAQKFLKAAYQKRKRMLKGYMHSLG
jgi:CheY-like chemotaxis protein